MEYRRERERENFFYHGERIEAELAKGKATRSSLFERVATLSCGLAGFPAQLYRRPTLRIGYPLSNETRERETRIRVIKVHETRDHRPLYRSPRPIYLDHTLDPPGTRICGFFTASSLH